MRKPKKDKFSLRGWLVKHHLSVMVIISAIVVSGVFLIAISSVKSSSGEDIVIVVKPKPKKKVIAKTYSPLTGLEVSSKDDTTRPVTAMMIENSPAARPQSGLKKAGVVYEAQAEGGITRFMALYQGEKPNLIGPVRSLRIYYLNWAAPYQASIGHVGGSDNALAEVRNGKHRDIDQFFNGAFYWRSTDRYAPHNVYTSGEKIDRLNSSKGYNKSDFTSFARTDEKPAQKPLATKININFSSQLYNTMYEYDKASNSYKRFMAGKPHADRESGQITPKVIVALEVATQRRSGPDGYQDIITSGSGKATIFQDGLAIPASWRKDSMLSPLKLIDANGKDIKLVRGQTWIGAFVSGRGGLSWQ